LESLPELIVGALVLGGAVAAASLVIGFGRIFRRPGPGAERVPVPPSTAPADAREVSRRRPPQRVDWRAGLARTRGGWVARLGTLLGTHRTLDQATLEELEALLFGADLGARTAESLLDAARAARDPSAVRVAMKERSLAMLTASANGPVTPGGPPHVILVVGVNGSGKTTTIGKLAHRYLAAGKRVMLAAGDTFRAAAIDQLVIWGERTGADIVRGVPGGDPASIAFDAVRAARSRGHEVVIIDTAGRLQTDRGLMDELTKISRVVRKELPDAPHEVLLVLDANTGQNAIRQAEEFSRAVPVTGIVLTKLDGTAKGGVILGIVQEVGVPVRYVGLGESADALADFDAEAFVAGLFDEA
jgi:fused signal recognition particle receptor